MNQKLLCVVAHPDDECFAFGGALALAVDAGAQVRVVCLTDGQAATNRGESRSPEDLGRMRREEFSASCRILGVQDFSLLDYGDAQLEFAQFSEAAERLVRLIRAFQPQVVLTFGMDGAMNTHPDHSMVAAMTSAAFHWAGLEKRFPGSGPVHRAERLFTLSTDFFMEDRPAPAPTPWTLKLDISQVLGRKQEAFRAHTSQAPLVEKTRKLFEEHGQYEFYTLAAVREPQPAQQISGMFEGLAAHAEPATPEQAESMASR